jgi:hypothetical protein
MAQVDCCVTRNAVHCPHDPVVPAQGTAAFLRIGILGRDTASTRKAVRGRWSIWVNGNWRLTFEFRDGQAYVLDYEDYH